jgi:hypothetical protein
MADDVYMYKGSWVKIAKHLRLVDCKEKTFDAHGKRYDSDSNFSPTMIIENLSFSHSQLSMIIVIIHMFSKKTHIEIS